MPQPLHQNQTAQPEISTPSAISSLNDEAAHLRKVVTIRQLVAAKVWESCRRECGARRGNEEGLEPPLNDHSDDPTQKPQVLEIIVLRLAQIERGATTKPKSEAAFVTAPTPPQISTKSK